VKKCVFLGYTSEPNKTDWLNVNQQVIIPIAILGRNGENVHIGKNPLWDVSRDRALKESDISHLKTFHSFFVISVEADEEMKESESRGLTDEEKKENPSEIMSSLEKGFGAIASLVSDEFEQ
jgi:hypothetical protein